MTPLPDTITNGMGNDCRKAGSTLQLGRVDPKRNETNTVVLIRQKFTVPKQ